jgi:hypothetical protein
MRFTVRRTNSLKSFSALELPKFVIRYWLGDCIENTRSFVQIYFLFIDRLAEENWCFRADLSLWNKLAFRMQHLTQIIGYKFLLRTVVESRLHAWNALTRLLICFCFVYFVDFTLELVSNGNVVLTSADDCKSMVKHLTYTFWSCGVWPARSCDCRNSLILTLALPSRLSPNLKNHPFACWRLVLFTYCWSLLSERRYAR